MRSRAERYSEASDIRIRGSSSAEDWSVIRHYHSKAEPTPIETELVVFTGLTFEEAAARAEAMQKYLHSRRYEPPPTWPS